jgi:uncharacterized membrane protein YraQ (UPF0718 family)
MRIFYIVAAVVCAIGIGYLLLTSMEKEKFFAPRIFAKWLFPNLDCQARHQKWNSSRDSFWRHF